MSNGQSKSQSLPGYQPGPAERFGRRVIGFAVLGGLDALPVIWAGSTSDVGEASR